MNLKIRAEREPWAAAIAIRMAEEKPFGLAVAGPVTFTVQDEGLVVEPFLRLQMREAQLLMDELWHCGLRPSEGAGSAGSLKATENHLADMKRIAFTLLDRPNVELTGAAAALLPQRPATEGSEVERLVMHGG